MGVAVLVAAAVAVAMRVTVGGGVADGWLLPGVLVGRLIAPRANWIGPR